MLASVRVSTPRRSPAPRLLAALACAAALGAGCLYPTPPPPAPLDGMPMRRLDRVDGAVYRGSQPSQRQFAELVERYGIRTVVKLDSDHEGRDVVPPGVRVIHDPLPTWMIPPVEQVHRVLDDIDAAEKPVYVHCLHGEDRTGLIVALYRVRHGASPEQAYLDMMLHAFHPYRGVWRAWLREVGWVDARR